MDYPTLSAPGETSAPEDGTPVTGADVVAVGEGLGVFVDAEGLGVFVGVEVTGEDALVSVGVGVAVVCDGCVVVVVSVTVDEGAVVTAVCSWEGIGVGSALISGRDSPIVGSFSDNIVVRT